MSLTSRVNGKGFTALITFLIAILVVIVGWLLTRSDDVYASRDRVDGIEYRVEQNKVALGKFDTAQRQMNADMKEGFAELAEVVREGR